MKNVSDRRAKHVTLQVVLLLICIISLEVQAASNERSYHGDGKRQALKFPASRQTQPRCRPLFKFDKPQTPPTSSASVRNVEFTPRIVGGSPINANLSKHLALLLISSSAGTQVCTGTIVGRRHILTAAHCRPNLQTTVRLTDSTTSPNDDVILGVRRYMTHPRYRQTPSGMSYDIAFIETDRNIPNRFKPMPINSNPRVPAPNAATRVAGYGAFKEEADFDELAFNARRALHQVDVPVVRNRECNIVYENIINDRFQVCAGYLGRGGCDSCQGDSGGPLLQYKEDGTPVLVGVVSIGVGCARKRFPGVYIRTSAFMDWIPRNVIKTTNSTFQVDSGYEPPSSVPRPSPSGQTSNMFLIIFAAILVVGILVTVVACLACWRTRRG